jgi:hypothetical protein
MIISTIISAIVQLFVFAFIPFTVYLIRCFKLFVCKTQ